MTLHFLFDSISFLRWTSALATPLFYISLLISFLIKQTVSQAVEGLVNSEIEWRACDPPQNETFCIQGTCYLKKNVEYNGWDLPRCWCKSYYTGKRCQIFFLPAGLMAGVIFLGVILLVIAAVAIVFVCRRRHKNAAHKSSGRTSETEQEVRYQTPLTNAEEPVASETPLTDSLSRWMLRSLNPTSSYDPDGVDRYMDEEEEEEEVR